MTSDEMLLVRPEKSFFATAQCCPVHAWVGLISARPQSSLRWEKEGSFCSSSSCVLPQSFPGWSDASSSPWGLSVDPLEMIHALLPAHALHF